MHLQTNSARSVSAFAGEARFLHALVLLVGSCIPVLGTVLIAPVLPRIQEHFGGLPNVEILAPLALTIPALFIGLLASFAGALADKYGPKRLLVISMIIYGVFGTAPIWLDGLHEIILTRAGVGIAESVVMTCCTALIADYFEGVRREKYLALQTVWTTAAATLFLFTGGFLGGFGWRVPFWLYAASFLLAAIMQKVLFKPHGKHSLPPANAENINNSDGRVWIKLAFICAITFFGSIAFFTVQVELGFLLNLRGIQSTQTIGLTIGLGAAMVMVGALVFRRIFRFGVPLLLTLGFGATGVGFVVIGNATNYFGILIGTLIHGGGAGLLLPTLVTWAMRILRFGQRGRGSGAWNACFFLGQFVCPFVVLGITSFNGGLPSAIVVMGGILLAIAGGAATSYVIQLSRRVIPSIDTSRLP